MSRVAQQFHWIVAGLLLMSPALSRGQQPSAGRGRPVIFSDPIRDTVTTNLNQVATRRLPLQNLTEDLKKPFEIFDVADPTRRQVSVPPKYLPPPPTLESKQLRNLMEKNKDWVFKSQQDYEAAFGLTAADIFKVQQFEPDGQPKKKTTAMERAFDRLAGPRHALTNQGDIWSSREKGGRKDDLNRTDAEKSPASASMLDQTLRRLSVNGDSRDSSTAADGRPRTIADVFGISGGAEANAALRAQELRLEEYRKILDPHAVPAAAGASYNLFGASPAVTPGNPVSRGLNPLPVATTPRETWNALPGSVGAPLSPRGLADSTLRLPDLGAPLPLPEKPATPPQPAGFTVPKRKF